MGTAELLEDMFEGIIEKGSAIKGFGTKVKEMEAAQQALIALDKAEPLDGEDETDVFLRLYGVGRDGDDVIKRYEEAMSAFDDVPTMVSGDDKIVFMRRSGNEYHDSKRSHCCHCRRKSTLQLLVVLM